MAITSEKNVRSGALVKTYFKVAEIWKLSANEQTALLGLPDNSGIYTSWKNIPSSAVLDKEKLVKLTLILAIYKDVQILHPETDLAATWLRTAIDAAPFNGSPPIDVLKQGKIASLQTVRQYLTSVVGPVVS